ncbi:hypothetical protein HanIR_Chr16g0788101 [Helianthus annuus]|nr:hypothetical protein HanIR_Chr16g0788101 [Helianthus annuus]
MITCITFSCNEQIPLLILRKLQEPFMQEHKIVPSFKFQKKKKKKITKSKKNKKKKKNKNPFFLHIYR